MHERANECMNEDSTNETKITRKNDCYYRSKIA